MMDKRSLIFVILLALSFYFMQNWLGDKSKKQNQTQLAQQQSEEAEVQKNLIARTAKIDTLPLVPFYIEKGKNDPITYGIKINGQYITLAWQSNLPSEIYTPNDTLKLAFKNTRKNEPALYSQEIRPMPILKLSTGESFDLQLITLVNGKPKVFLGEYQDGFIRFPLQSPQSNAIALFYANGTYYPLFFYDVSQQKLIPLQNFSNFAHLTETKPFKRIISDQNGEEKFYVLENEYQQLVFSNVGGAIAEINLPFMKSDDEKSIIHPIEFDKKIEQESPKNAFFPLHGYYSYDDKSLHTQGKLGGYYPLMRRSILSENGTYQKKLSPEFYTFAINDNQGLIKFQVVEFTKDRIVFEATTPQRRIRKTFSMNEKAPYMFDVDISIEGNSQGLFLSSGLPEVELVSGNFIPSLKYKITRNGKNVIEKMGLPKPKTTVTSIAPDWISNANGFFGIIIDPISNIGSGYEAKKIIGSMAPTRLTLIDPQYHSYPADKYPAYQFLLPLSERSGTSQFRVYAGPYQKQMLTIADKIHADPLTGYTPDYIGAKSFHGWFSFISEPFAKFLFLLMNFFYKLTHSWGFSIILLTIALRIMLYPLNAWSIRSSVTMQQLAPKVKSIQAKYKKDPKKAQMETMKLYRESGANPLTGCFPIIIQMPFLIGMFDLLKSTFELRGVAFIPGWIDNLTAPDVLFSWSYHIFFFGTQFHLLPLLLGVLMYLQQRISSNLPKDKSQWTDKQKQQKMMGNITAIIFTILFYNFPSGLTIYWLSSTLIGILQQFYITKKVKSKTT